MNEKYPLALPQGTILAGQYIIEEVLGQGGFGITYRALDHKSGEKVALKEFFPDTLAARTSPTTVSAFSGPKGEDFEYGKSCFLQEAETLARFIGNDNIVRVHSYFEENGTAYFVMDFIDGISFADYIRHYGGKISYEKSLNALIPVMDALGAVHNQGIIHRDVTPDNIFITKDGIIKLIDFGAARYSLGDKSQSLDIVLKHGYAPKEQYMRHGKQGPFTDVYSLGACFYFAVTGKLPPDSIDRMDEDKIVPVRSLGIDIPEAADKAIMKALSVRAEERFQSMDDFKMALFGRQPAAAKPSPVKQRFFTPPDADPKDDLKTVLMDTNAVQQSFKQIPNDHIRPKRSHSGDEEEGDRASALRPRGDVRAGAARRVSGAGYSDRKPRRRRRDIGILAGPLILYVVIACFSLLLCVILILLSHKLFKTGRTEEKAEVTTEETAGGNGERDTVGGSSEAGDETASAAETAAESTDNSRGKAELGIIGYTILDDMKEGTGLRGGVYVNDVQEGKGAKDAGIHSGDIISGIEQRTILDMETLKEVLSYHKPGDTIKVIILRQEDDGYVEKELEVTLSAMEEI